MFSDTVVILAAGRGSRMQSDIPKVMIEVAGKPILDYVMEFWINEGAHRFVFVLGYESAMIVKHLSKVLKRPFCLAYQKEQKGIAHAILQAEKLVPDNFIVALGDCLNLGKFTSDGGIELGYGLWVSQYHKQLELCCSARVENDRIVRIIEKAQAPYVGIGTYFFNRRIFKYIRSTQPSIYRNEIEITDVMQKAIDVGECFKPVYFYGDFVNCTTRQDIEYAEKLLS